MTKAAPVEVKLDGLVLQRLSPGTPTERGRFYFRQRGATVTIVNWCGESVPPQALQGVCVMVSYPCHGK